MTMVKTSGDFEKEFITEASATTGKSVEEWMVFIKKKGPDKRNDIMDWLKKSHNLNHLQANLLTGIYVNNGQPVYIDEDSLLENQFAKIPEMKAFYSDCADAILKAFPETRIIPKKTYVSFTIKREFAAMNIKKGEIRLGLDLGDEPFSEKIQKSKLTGPMPRISHMVVLQSNDDLTDQVTTLLQKSFDRCHS